MGRYRVRLVRAVLETATVNVTAHDEELARAYALSTADLLREWTVWRERGESTPTVDSVEEVE